MSIEQLIRNLNNVRRDLKELEYEEEYLRDQLLTIMDNEGVNTLRTPTHQATRRFQVRDMVLKKNVPRSVWDRYSTPIEYEVVTIKPR